MYANWQAFGSFFGLGMSSIRRRGSLPSERLAQLSYGCDCQDQTESISQDLEQNARDSKGQGGLKGLGMPASEKDITTEPKTRKRVGEQVDPPERKA